ncbi:MAG: polysaccharide biosynthesis tyrosine autokinase [Bdellovibrionales bacterium]|nr:polysaccharide biosynthesis tyrosine autokinase [Bdellovibrionales bacterium]
MKNKVQELSDRRAFMFAAIEVLRAKKAFLILTCTLAVTGTFLGHYTQKTEYSTSATLFVQSIEEPTAAEYLLNQHVGRAAKSERIETYMRYLSSDTFFLSVAQKIKFHPDYANLNFTSVQNQSILSVGFWKNLMAGPTESKDIELSIDDIEGRVKQMVSYDSDYSHFVYIKTKTLDPRTAQVVANVIAEEFVSMTNARGLEEIEHIQAFVKGKLEETQERLKTNEVELIDFKKKNSIISTDTSSSLLADRYTKIASELESSKLQYEENQKLLDYFEKGQKSNIESISENPKELNGVKETSIVLQRKLEQLKRQKSVILAQEDKSQEWRLEALDKEINRTAQAFRHYAGKLNNESIFAYMNPQKIQMKINELKEENQILKSKISTHTKAMAEIKEQVENIPSMAQKQFFFENNLKLENENYTNLKNKLMELEIQRLSLKKEIRVDQAASLPGAVPKGSLTLKLLFSFFASMLFGVGIIIGIEAIDPTIKHRSDLGECGVEFIGDIPLIPEMNSGPKKTFKASHKLVCLNTPESLEAMAFKYIRARIESMRYKFKKEHQVISISSSAVHDGKSFVTANLAVSLSQLKRKTLLIDCDLRRPSQNSYFEVSPQFGLVDLLDMKKNLDEVLMKDTLPYLDYLPAGFCSQNSTEYISSEKFRALISYLRDQYDYVIIDTPPTFAAVDASVLAAFSDIPILICNFRETKKHELHEAYSQLLQVSYKQVYGIINKAILSTTRFHYYGYHSYSKSEKANVGSLSSLSENSSDIQKFLDNLKTKSS